MRRGLAVLFVLAVAGCGVSKDVYRAEVVKSQELEARAGDLSSRLQTEEQKRRAVEEDLAARRQELETAQAALTQAGARTRDLESRLAASTDREAGLRADLDLCRTAQGASEADLQTARRELAAGKTALEDCRAEVATRDARLAVLEEQKAKVEQEKREKLDEISRTYEGLLEGLKDEVEQGRVTISRLQGKLSVNVLDEILFDSGSVAIKSAGKDVLKRLGELLEGVPDKAIVIEGHTDDVPISPELARRYPTNWELSTARAAAVVRYLQEDVGIAPERLSAVGFGPFRPVADNDTPEGRARNRRIEVKLIPLEAPLFASPEKSEKPEKPESGEGATPAGQ